MKRFIEYIDKSIEQLQQEERMLATTDRKDESNLVKIRINVYGICKSVFQVFAQSEVNEDLKSTYLKKIDGLAVGWQEAKDKAQKFQAIDKVVIEEIKLQTLADIRLEFLKIWEERAC